MENRHVLVVGMARSGIAVAKLLRERGAAVRINDIRREAEFEGALDALKPLGVEWRLGEPAESLLSGIDLLLISPGVPIDHPAVLKAKELGIEVAGELEIALRLSAGTLIAITGTNGKTTTTTLVGEIMRNAGKLTHVVGNIGRPASEIAQQSKADDVIVCEVSSFQLESVRDFHPSISAILNISEDHLYRHGTMQNYIDHKARIYQNQGAGDALVLNYDDPVLRALPTPDGVDVIWFSRLMDVPRGAFVRDGMIVYGDAQDYRPICALDEVGIPGSHNLENALAAAAIAMAAQVPPPVIRHTLRTFAGVEHRLEFVRELDSVSYINDSKGTNVASTLKAIEAMDRPSVILLGGRNPGANFSELARALTGSRIHDAVLLGESADALAQALDGAGFGAYEHAGFDLEKAVHLARAKAKPGGNVLLSPACKSFDMFGDYEERGRVFKRIVNELGEIPA